jgi:hypothetical protein
MTPTVLSAVGVRVVINPVGSLGTSRPHGAAVSGIRRFPAMKLTLKTAVARRELEETPMRDQRPCEEFRSWRTLMDDPLTRLLMKADRVETSSLQALLSAAAQRQRGDHSNRPARFRLAA